jgi:hypothetical protein
MFLLHGHTVQYHGGIDPVQDEERNMKSSLNPLKRKNKNKRIKKREKPPV